MLNMRQTFVSSKYIKNHLCNISIYHLIIETLENNSRLHYNTIPNLDCGNKFHESFKDMFMSIY